MSCFGKNEHKLKRAITYDSPFFIFGMFQYAQTVFQLQFHN